MSRVLPEEPTYLVVVGSDAPRVAESHRVQCEEVDPLLSKLGLRADIVVLRTISAELVDLLAARQQLGKASVLDVAAILEGASPGGRRTRLDLIRLATPIVDGVVGSTRIQDTHHIDDLERWAQGAACTTRNGFGSLLARTATFPDGPTRSEQLRKALEHDTPRSAITALLELAEAWPDTPLPRARAARLLNDLGEANEALQLLLYLLPRHPHNSGAWCELGRALFRLGQPQARSVLVDTVKRCPWQLDGWRYLLQLLELEADAAGEAWARQAVQAHPSNHALGLRAARLCSAEVRVELLHEVLDGIAWQLHDDEMAAIVPAFSAACATLPRELLAQARGLELLARGTALFPMSLRLAHLHGEALHACGRRAAGHAEHARAARLKRLSLTP